MYPIYLKDGEPSCFPIQEQVPSSSVEFLDIVIIYEKDPSSQTND